MRHRILAAILDFVEETEKRKKKFTRQIPQGQYAYCKYLEIIRVGVFEWEQKQMAAADSAKTISLHHHIVGGDLINTINQQPTAH